jgi:3-dehydroquinate dehydratase/shikimate dehydrogenase
MGLICAALNVKTTAEARAAMLRARADGADLAELRLDLMEEFDLEALLAERPLPAVVTFRRMDQGSGHRMDERKRLAILNRALELGAEYVDVELGSQDGIVRSGPGKVIVSHHDFGGVPADIEELARRIEATGADIVKLAVAPGQPLECLALYELIAKLGKPAIVVGMGEAGAASRLIALRFGAFLSYGALAPDERTAPGQLSVAEMVRDYRAKSVSESTRLFGVIGDPIAHSLSPAIHNAAYREMGLDALYVGFRVPADSDAAEFVRRHADSGFEGLSVTLPHKVAALGAADQVDPVAARIGAANTIIVRDGRLHAANTDADAAVGELARAFGAPDRTDQSDPADPSDRCSALAGKTVLVLGAGGAARAVAWGLSVLGRARVVIANRSRERGMNLAAELQAEFRPLDQLAGLAYDAVVNATPQGMHPNVGQTPLAAELIRPGSVVFDTIYNPLETRLLREAKERGARTVDGLGMFVAQGARQVELWTGRPAPREVMRRAALEKLTRK